MHANHGRLAEEAVAMHANHGLLAAAAAAAVGKAVAEAWAAAVAHLARRGSSRGVSSDASQLHCRHPYRI